MRPIADMPDDTAAGITTVFTDIDDTVTTEGRLHASAYQALEDLHEAGIAVAPITGRPAGWCDMIARFWPVAGVVGGLMGGTTLAREHEIAVSKIGVSAAELEAMTLAAIDAAFDDDADGYLAEMRGRVRAFYAQHAFVL